MSAPSHDDIAALTAAMSRLSESIAVPALESPADAEPAAAPEPDRAFECALDDLARAARKASTIARGLNDAAAPLDAAEIAETLAPIAALYALTLFASGLPEQTIEALAEHQRTARAVLCSVTQQNNPFPTHHGANQ